MSNKPIFDEWESVSCNNCTHYWDDSCNGVSEGSEKPCKAFKATRRIDLPDKLERLTERVNSLVGWLAFESIVICVLVYWLFMR